MVSIEVFVNA